ncbi:hypothetical protein L2729_12565 [Shewanella gelidimarina]|uniref:hypothetical protein n=1 Tax=Shewanella gelidimarina TaxID=56813 RepID=UPI00200D9AC6|nr:hypothetical protein [Shewanella gelidimarina]MCL1058815.1 hypothetical protein [Shewanella gelidimarina]
MFVFAMELVFWLLWDFVLSSVFCLTGALLIRIFTFGNTRYPLTPLSYFRRRKYKEKDPFNTTFIVGFSFYLCLLIIAIWIG